LTEQQWTRGTEVPAPGKEAKHAVYNMHPCPLPGGRVAFVSNRDGLVSPGNKGQRSTMQLFVMDDDGNNVEKIGHLNLAAPCIRSCSRMAASSSARSNRRVCAIAPSGVSGASIPTAPGGGRS